MRSLLLVTSVLLQSVTTLVIIIIFTHQLLPDFAELWDLYLGLGKCSTSYWLIHDRSLQLRQKHISDMIIFFQAELNKPVTEKSAVGGLPTDGKNSPEKHHSLLLEVSALSPSGCTYIQTPSTSLNANSLTYMYILGFSNLIIFFPTCCHIV